MESSSVTRFFETEEYKSWCKDNWDTIIESFGDAQITPKTMRNLSSLIQKKTDQDCFNSIYRTTKRFGHFPCKKEIGGEKTGIVSCIQDLVGKFMTRSQLGNLYKELPRKSRSLSEIVDLNSIKQCHLMEATVFACEVKRKSNVEVRLKHSLCVLSIFSLLLVLRIPFLLR